MFISQPNNSLITRLGMGALWNAPHTASRTLSKYATSGALNISTYLRILFKSGVIYSHHPFFHKMFVISNELLSLPVYMTEDTFPKFYRIHRLKATLHYSLKRVLTLRRFLQFVNLSSTHFYRLGNVIVVMMYIHLPSILKRGKPSEVRKREQEALRESASDAGTEIVVSPNSTWNFIWHFYSMKLVELVQFNIWNYI